MKRTALKRKTPLRAKTRIKLVGSSETADVKQEIQDVLRAIVIKRDGGCFLRHHPDHQSCGGYRNDGELILQADHLIERSNSATYADPRLAVCVCKGVHGWKHFKKSNHDQYNAMVRMLLPSDRIALWERCEADSWRPVRTGAYDWKLTLAALKQELAKMPEPVWSEQ